MSNNIENIELNNILIKYLSDEASKPDKKYFNDWLNKADENKFYFNKIEKFWKNSLTEEEKKTFNTDNGWNSFIKKYKLIQVSKLKAKKTSTLKTITYNLLKVAAVFIIAVITFITIQNYTKTINIQTSSAKKEVFLPDKSTVYLNKNTKISYNKNLKKKNSREIKLTGEAFFDVEHNPLKPFIVYANNIKVEVKGTSFNIRAFAGEDVEVIVKSGIVEVSKIVQDTTSKPVKLNIGEKIEIDTSKKILKAEKNKDPNYLAWKTESYNFDSVYISQVIQSLEKGFDTTIIVNNREFNNCMLVAKFDSLSLEEIFWILQRTYNISVFNKNDTIFIDGKGCD